MPTHQSFCTWLWFVGNPGVGDLLSQRDAAAGPQSFEVNPSVHKLQNGCEQDERAVSGTIGLAPALTSRKRRESVFALYRAREAQHQF